MELFFFFLLSQGGAENSITWVTFLYSLGLLSNDLKGVVSKPIYINLINLFKMPIKLGI
jgi:hypothetical protein